MARSVEVDVTVRWGGDVLFVVRRDVTGDALPTRDDLALPDDPAIAVEVVHADDGEWKDERTFDRAAIASNVASAALHLALLAAFALLFVNRGVGFEEDARIALLRDYAVIATGPRSGDGGRAREESASDPGGEPQRLWPSPAARGPVSSARVRASAPRSKHSASKGARADIRDLDRELAELAGVLARAAAGGSNGFADATASNHGGGAFAGDGSLESGAGGLSLSGAGEGGGGPGAGVGLVRTGTCGENCTGFGKGRLAAIGHQTKAWVRCGIEMPKDDQPCPGTQVNGRLPPEAVQRVVRANFGRFRMCYERALEKNPSLEGRVSVKFVIDEDGTVSSARDDGSDLRDAPAVACVVRAMGSLRFPKPEGGVVIVVYPLMLTAL